MSIEKYRNYIKVHLSEKTFTLRGHQDEDAFRVFTEDLEGNPRLSDEDVEAIRGELSHYPEIVID